MQRYGETIRGYCQHVTWAEDKGWIIRRNNEYPPIYLGSEQLEKRIDILHAFISKMKEEERDMRNFKYVSLRFNDQVIVRD
ncbi:MAG: hypothetical protein U5N26_09290 [Candidatus Marinimicrobia bacterium]|nr:hypothetical protein [Candidatus Neomarinimicrobiota bacterium]